jgi:hypothetical protein
MLNRTAASLIRISVLACAWAVLAGPAWARPAYKKALGEHFGPLLARKLNDCRTCHLPDPPGGPKDESAKPHNAFGARLAAIKKELKRAGKETDIIARLEASADEDSDGDGVSNIVELLTGHFPGDVADKPSTAELARADVLRREYRKVAAGYRWKPFEPVKRPAIPAVKNAAWVRNPIDAFLAVEHEKLGLKPRPEASRHVLIRRLYLDLIGMPPTPEEIQAFVSDASVDAYEKVVDCLLQSPHYGERWGRHWMDIWRYSDWAGYGPEVRDSQPNIWRWRDWIIDSLNADKGYDRMIEEMLAADEIAPEDPDVLRASGFLVRNWFRYNRNVWLERIVEHTSKAFLGVTMNCARCHDHFFDPITQKEYYQFRAIFEPHNIRTDRVPGSDPAAGVVRVYDATLAAKTFLFVRGDESKPDKDRPLDPAVPASLTHTPYRIQPIKLPAAVITPEKQESFKKLLLADAEKAFITAKEALGKTTDRTTAQREVELAQAKWDSLRAVLAAEALEEKGILKGEDYEKAAKEAQRLQRQVTVLETKKNLSAAEKELTQKKSKKTAANSALLKKRDDAAQALAKADIAGRLPLTTAYTKRAITTYAATSSGRRLALAQWLADKNNPLTARVAVNHIWLRHFGKPLVSSVFDFGANGQKPTHPALLDWLAAEFIEPGGWSMKKLHRLLVTSSAYRMESSHDAACAEKDADNRLVWRMNPRRMEAEIVRDSVLAVAGSLDRTFGGPELDQNLGLTTQRRSIYYRHAAEKTMEFMDLFDGANVTECYERTVSVVPQQALAMANSTLVLAQARLLTRNITKKLGETATPSDFIRAGFEHVLCRVPTDQEQALCGEFLTKQVQLLAAPKGLSSFTAGQNPSVAPGATPDVRARENLIHVLLNHNEFVTIR